MHDFFKVLPVSDVLALKSRFAPVSTETVSLENARGRVLASAPSATDAVPGFSRSTMDGFAVCAQSTFGASESMPALLTVTGQVEMGTSPEGSVEPLEAFRIPTGGMLPDGADSVVMIEQTREVDATRIEVFKPVAPGTHVIVKGDDIEEGAALLSSGLRLRPQELGYLSAAGIVEVPAFRKPVVGILSTGDEVVPTNRTPEIGQVRDINAPTLSAMVEEAGGIARGFGIVKDDFKTLSTTLKTMCTECDMVLLSGGSSVGTRDHSVSAITGLEDAELLVHGMAIRPGKPTILARVGNTPVWGLPGHAASAAMVFLAVVRPMLLHLSGDASGRLDPSPVSATLSRNVASAPGRDDYVRVRLEKTGDGLLAHPVLGESGLIRTLVAADGVMIIDTDTEGALAGQTVSVTPI